MEIIKYEIKKGDTLQSIAEKEHQSVDEIIRFHNENCGLTHMIIGDQIPFQLNFLLINRSNPVKSTSGQKNGMEMKARYRCEQVNISKINNEIIHLAAITNSEYLVKQNKEDKHIFEVSLTDTAFTVDPIIYKQGFEFSLELERLRTPVHIRVNASGTAGEVYNSEQLLENWKAFRDNQLKKNTVYNQMLSQSPEQARDLVATGDREFSSMTDFAETLDKNLFFHIILRSFLGSHLPDYELTQMSQIFPGITLNTHVTKSLVKEDDETEMYRLVGTYNRNNASDDVLAQMYDEIYKPMIKYGFTEFDFIYRIHYIIEKKSGLLTEGKAAISEKVKNNYEISTEYTVKRVEL